MKDSVFPQNFWAPGHLQRPTVYCPVEYRFISLDLHPASDYAYYKNMYTKLPERIHVSYPFATSDFETVRQKMIKHFKEIVELLENTNALD